MSLSSDNKSIKIPAQHYVGFVKRGDDEIPLGFMTIEGSDAAALKRKGTVDSWASGSRENKIAAQVFDNKPLTGFKMGKSIRHNYSSWGQGNVKWRIEDPRGFELEITSPNFASLLSCTTIENGEILEKCIWGRLGADNVLLPVTSDVYKAATENTERLNKSASLRDAKPGDHVVMQNGVTGRFLGNLFLIKRETYNKHALLVDGKKRCIVQTETDSKTTFLAISSPKLSEITPGERITLEQAETLINDAAKAGADISTAGYGYGQYVGVSTTAKVEFTYSLKPFKNLTEAQNLVKESGYRGCILGNKDDTWGVYSEKHNKQESLTLLHINVLKDTHELQYVNTTKMHNHGGYNWGRGYEQPVVYDILPGDQISWYGHECEFKTPNGYVNKTLF